MNPHDFDSIKRALVKIWFKSGQDYFFKGTGFFIHPNGYLLTAYHCVKGCKDNLVVESHHVGKKRAVVLSEHSLPGVDIAVLQLADPDMENTAPFYLPLGTVTDNELNTAAVVVGYPQRDTSKMVAEIAVYQGHINRLFKEGENFLLECQAIVGQGQSGSPVYHPITRRVVAMAHSMYDEMRSGDAVRFELLFQCWRELTLLNQESEEKWEQQQIISNRQNIELEISKRRIELQQLQEQRQREERELQQRRVEIEQKQLEESERLKTLQMQRVQEEQRLQQQVEAERKQREEAERLQQLQAQRDRETRQSTKVTPREETFTFETVTSLQKKVIEEPAWFGLTTRQKEILEPVLQKRQGRQLVYDLGQGVTVELVYIPAGEFMMGAVEGEGDSDEHPRHKVTIAKPFYMGKYLVTQAQWQAVMGNNPSRFKGENRPVETVSWKGAKAFCEKLSERLGEKFDLPSEAQWEYACRAGTTTKYSFGDMITSQLANYNQNIGQTTEVGKYPANGFGLYDMHGNVWEWLEDVWHGNYEGAPNDGSAWIVGGESNRYLLRGGSWHYIDNYLRCAGRGRFDAAYRYYVWGFRFSRM